MKKLLALLLASILLLSLCACGGAATETAVSSTPAVTEESPAAAGESAPAEEAPEEPAEPEKTYVEKQMVLPVLVTEKGLDDYYLDQFGPVTHIGYALKEYDYDEYGVPVENVRYITMETQDFLDVAEMINVFPEDFEEDYSVELDEAGEPLSVTMPDSMWGYEGLEATAEFENGRLVRIEKDPGDGTIGEEIVLEYDASGSIRKETTKTWTWYSIFKIFYFDDPMITVREYNENGRCTRLHTEEPDLDYGVIRLREYRWEYDAAGNPVRMTLEEGSAGNTPLEGIETAVTRTASMQYDEAGRMISAEKEENGVKTSYSYRYNDEGILTGVTRTSGDQEIVSEYEYNEDGLLTADRRTVNGKAGKDVLYSWEEGPYSIVGSASTKDPDFDVLLSSELHVISDRINDDGTPWRTHTYRLLPSPAILEPVYFESTSEFEYQTRIILVEAED